MKSRDYEEFIESLKRSGARFLVVGAHAVAFYARPRATKDLDLFILGYQFQDPAGRPRKSVNAAGELIVEEHDPRVIDEAVRDLAMIGLNYVDECFAATFSYVADYSNLTYTKPVHRIMLRMNLRTIGGTGFGTQVGSERTGN